MIDMLNRPPVARQVPLLGQRRPGLAGHRPPTPAWRPRRQLAQVNVNPEVNVPVTVELGSLPVIIGAFAASGISFLVGSQVKSARSVTDILGIGFAGLGIVNLFLGGASEAAASEDAVDAPEGVDANASDPIPATNEDAFLALEGRVIYPTEQQEVDLGFTATEMPVRIRLTNPTSSSVTFDLVLKLMESPNIGEAWETDTSMRVTLGGGQTRDINVNLPLSKWGGNYFVDYSDVDLNVMKRRIHGGNAQRLAHRFFVIE